MHLTPVDLYPPLGLTIVAGPLELRGLADTDLAALCELALDGIHPADQMPFLFPWTEAPRADLARNTAQYHWGLRSRFTPAAWDLQLGVWLDGVLVGSQGFATRDYLVTRTGETGSWLGQAHQGRGIGTAMRQAICAFVFDHLDAATVTSSAFVDNPASMAVSRKVGYRPNGTRVLQRRVGERAELHDLVLSPDDLVRGPHPLQVTGVEALRRAIGLD